VNPSDRCPCGSGETYAQCCERFHLGAMAAPTAVALMRSRFSAFAVGDENYLVDSWHPSTRPNGVPLDPQLRWIRLDIINTVAGGPFDTTGIVEFRAHYRSPETRGALHERSTFVRQGGRWFYVSGDDPTTRPGAATPNARGRSRPPA
jgi:SEC-C motif-containing protein